MDYIIMGLKTEALGTFTKGFFVIYRIGGIMFKKLLVLIFLLVSFQHDAFSADKKSGAYQHLDIQGKEKFVYTPYKSEVPARLSSVAIDEINRKDWEAHKVYSLPEVLKFNSSTHVASSGISGPTGVLLWGKDSDHTPFLLVGV